MHIQDQTIIETKLLIRIKRSWDNYYPRPNGHWKQVISDQYQTISRIIVFIQDQIIIEAKSLTEIKRLSEKLLFKTKRSLEKKHLRANDNWIKWSSNPSYTQSLSEIKRSSYQSYIESLSKIKRSLEPSYIESLSKIKQIL